MVFSRKSIGNLNLPENQTILQHHTYKPSSYTTKLRRQTQTHPDTIYYHLYLLMKASTVKKIVVALSSRQKLLGTVSLYVRHFCPCNNTYQLIFHQLVERRAGISANSNYHGNSHSCEHSKCQNFCCSFPPTTNHVEATVSAAASWSKI